MQLEELQEQWLRLDRKLDRSLAIEEELVRRVVMRPARRRVKLLAFWPAVDVAFGGVVLLLGGAFVGDHWGRWGAAAPAAVVMLCAAALLADGVRQLLAVAGLDWDGPVAEIQGALGRLRAAKVRQFKWIILLSPLLWICTLSVGLHWLSGRLGGGVDLLGKFDARWVVANYVFGVLFVPAGYLVARALARRYHGHGWWRAALDAVSGTGLKAAAEDVARWASLCAGEPNPRG